MPPDRPRFLPAALTTCAGKTSEGTDVSGSIKVPECAYDTEAEEYVVRSSAAPTAISIPHG